jgi:S1-C subfamily serine protease
VSTLDWIIVLFTVGLAIYGYLQGFIVGALSLAGFALGAFLGTRLAPLLLSQGNHSPYAPLMGLIGAVVLGALFAVSLEGLGVWMRRGLRLPGLGVVDGILGALLTACVALGLAWIAGNVALQTPGLRNVRQDVRKSEILRTLNDVLPPSGGILKALARFDPLPEINGPSAAVAPPTKKILRDPQVSRAAFSVVRVTGTACGLGIEGSGWVAPNDLVVTNAHVVAGEDDTQVQIRGKDASFHAQPVYVDSRNDVAVLRAPGLGLPALRFAGSVRTGMSGAVLGYPENGPFDARAARLGSVRTVSTQDAYGNGPVQRSILSFRGLVRSGNSGGPVVDGDGDVAGTVFAAVVGASRPGGFAVPNGVVTGALRRARGHGPVSTGPCAG